MSNWPVMTGAGGLATPTGLNADARTVPVAGGVPAHTPGPWTELIASTPAGMRALALHVVGVRGTMMYDLGVGPGGAEQVFVPSLVASGSEFRWSGDGLVLPVAVPAGSRLAIRARTDDSAGGEMQVTAVPLCGHGFSPMPARSLVAIGAVPTDTRGTFVPNGYGGGAWIELTASAPRLRGFYLCATRGQQYTPVNVQIGLGAATQEQAITERLLFARADKSLHPNVAGPFWITIPGGARVSARAWGPDFDLGYAFHLVGVP